METVQAKLKTKTNGVERIKTEFPILGKRINRKPFIYFDNAATAHKPGVVLESLGKFYSSQYGKPKEEHFLGKEATSRVEEVCRFYRGTKRKKYRVHSWLYREHQYCCRRICKRNFKEGRRNTDHIS